MSTANKQCSARCEFECHKLVTSDRVTVVEDEKQIERFICPTCRRNHRNLPIVQMRVPNERI